MGKDSDLLPRGVRVAVALMRFFAVILSVVAIMLMGLGIPGVLLYAILSAVPASSEGVY